MVDKNKFGSYTVVEKLGHGTFAHVFKVKGEDGKLYALKAMTPKEKKKSERDNLKRSIERERDLGILSGIYSPYLVRYHSIFEDRETVCIVMELCPNGNLQDRIQQHIKNNTSFSEDDILEILYQVTSALFELHFRNIIHRDLKADNIFVGEDYNYRLGDYGVGKVLEDDDAQTTTMVGTPFYVAPEILMDEHKHGLPVDIWSLGVLIYYAMMKTYPFMARNPTLMVPVIISGRYQPIPAIGSGGIYSQELVALVHSMLVVNPEKRVTADMILENPIFGRYIKSIINSDIIGVLKRKKIPLKHVVRDPVLVTYLKFYSHAFTDEEQPKEEDVKKLVSMIAAMELKIQTVEKKRKEKEAKKKAKQAKDFDSDSDQDDD